MTAGGTKRGPKERESGAAIQRRRVAELSARLEEAEATLSAIYGGEVDAFVVSTPSGDAVYTLKGADHAYRIFLEDMGDGAVTLTRDGLILHANRRFAEIVGAPLQQVIGSTVFRFLPPSDAAAFRGLLGIAMTAGTRREASFESPRGRVPTLLSLNPLPGSDPPALCMVVTDLTEQQRGHQELLDAHRKVAESEGRFRFLVDSSLVGIFIATEGRIVFANVEQQRIFGHLPIPVAVKEVKNVLPEDRERFERLCDEASITASGTIEADVRFRPESRGEYASGLLWAHGRAGRIEYQGKKAVLVNMVDVTRAKEMEKIAAVQDKMASLGQVTAGIAHNISNPLSGMNLFLHTMKKLIEEASGLDVQTKEEADKVIEKLQEASGKIASVIRQVLDFVRPSPSTGVTVRVHKSIQGALELCGANLRKSRIAIDLADPKELPPCYPGGGLLEQVLMNVINNAAQALENHPGDRRIAIGSEVSDGFVVVRIADSGPGIPEKIRQKIFEPFFTTRPQGTGIGLAFSRRVLESVGGNIEVDGSALGGAEFRIRIPVGGREKVPTDR